MGSTERQSNILKATQQELTGLFLGLKIMGAFDFLLLLVLHISNSLEIK